MLSSGFLRCLLRKITLKKALVAIGVVSTFYGFLAINYSETVYDSCLANECHTKAQCIPSFDKYDCKCQNGFYGDGWKCFDIDECLLKIYNCTENSLCINHYGTYNCECEEGYNMTTKGTCKEIPHKKRTHCIPTDYDGYMECVSKVQWMKLHWQDDPCYRDNGIDGTVCSIMDYLETVEVFCKPSNETLKRKFITPPHQKMIVPMNRSKEGLLRILGTTTNFKWISNRVKSMWDDSSTAFIHLLNQGKLNNRKQKSVLVFIGALADTKWSWAANADKGGPLGELVQWSDLILSIYLLGYILVTLANGHRLQREFNLNACNDHVKLNEFDLIYTDIHGIQLMQKENINIDSIRCKLRVLDSFGTEARFNYIEPDYIVNDQSYGISKAQAQSLISNPYGYGGWKLHLKQFLTLFPHSPDNSFLGFVVGKSTHPPVDMAHKTNSCLVYGKEKYMWQGKDEYLQTINQFCKVYATVTNNPVGGSRMSSRVNLPKFINNYGVIKWDAVQRELKKVKIFVGLGFPYEGPAPLEAMANGAVFINPKLRPPHGRLHDALQDGKYFFTGKPTLRELTSQHPYLEQFVGKPHVYTIDIHNKTELESALQEIFQNFKDEKVESYLPYEFTHEGLLERINSYIQNQEYCTKDNTLSWPPKSALTVVMSTPHQSCKTACETKGLLCDNDMFTYVNEVSSANEMGGVRCEEIHEVKSLHAPYVEFQKCYHQTEKLLFSCVDSAQNKNISRVCPCRNFRIGQVALCSNC